MSPPIPIETLAQSLDAVLHTTNYPIFEGDEISDGLSDYFDEDHAEEAPFPVTARTKKERKKKHRKEKHLAQTTHDILSSYRSFLNEHDMEETGSRGSDPPEDGFQELDYYERRMKHGDVAFSRTASPGSNGTASLLRNFSMPDVPLGSSDDGIEEKTKYKLPPSLSSKRVKFGLLMSMGLLVIIVVVIGVSANGSRNKMPKKENTPGWHSEAAYILEHEHGDTAAKIPHYRKDPPEPMSIKDLPPSQILEPIVEKDVLKNSEVKPRVESGHGTSVREGETESEADSVSKENDAETETKTAYEIKSTPADVATNAANEPQSAGVASFDLGKILHDKFKPLWLTSKEGWNGGSHAEAMQFCKSIRGKELCPYSAMCPYGPGHDVMAGRRPVDFTSQGEQYAPVFGHANRWIMVGQKNGDPSTICKSHEQLEMRPPRWGLNAEQPELKQHIMCCTLA